jgi:hypothetical protein
LKLQEHFDAIIVSGDLKWEKPHPEIFLRACQMLGVEPFECLMIGDKLETDIAGGFQAQLGITVWVPNGEPGPSPTPPPDFTIPDVSHLVQILQGGKDKNKVAKNVRPKKNSTSGASSSGAAAGSPITAPVASTSSVAASANKSTEPEED